MDTLDLIDAFADIAGDASGQGARWRLGRALFARLGADWITVGSAARTRLDQPTMVTNVVPGLIDDYLGARLNEVDPWLAHCARSAEVAQLRIAPPARGPAMALDPRVPALMAAHGIHHAALIPALAGARVAGVVAYATCADAARRLEDPRAHPALRLLAALTAGADPNDDAPAVAGMRRYVVPHLSAREIEALTWLAAGHRIERIGEKMGIRPVTVGKHLVTARLKFGARTREEALARAVLRGIVRP